jgi:flagellar FliL protein
MFLFRSEVMGKICWFFVVALCFVSPLSTMAQDEEAPADEAGRYIDLKPAFVLNYGGVGRLRYLKTDISLRAGGGLDGFNDIRHHMPYLRHALVMSLSRATEEELSSMEGRELLRQKALEAVREVLMQEEGRQFVDDLLFNSFIVQR